MTPSQQGLLRELDRRMEEEAFHYHLLVEELKKESASLRQGSTDSLTESLRSLEVHIEAIRGAEPAVEKAVERLIEALDPKAEQKTLAALLSLLPAREAARIRSSQVSLEGLKKRAAQVNERNKTFVQESLAYWRELFSLLTQPFADSPVYIQSGRRRASAHLPFSVNRKV